MPIYLEIAVNVPRVSGVFHYHLPPELEGRVRSGHLVEVPFGRQRVQGVVLGEVAEPEVPETKAVAALLDENVVLTQAQIHLAGRMARATLAPLASCVALMLPPGISRRADTLYRLADPLPASPDSVKHSALQNRVLALLNKRGALRGRQIDRSFPSSLNWRRAVRPLLKEGWLLSEPVLPPPGIRPKTIRTAQLAAAPEAVSALLDELGRTQATKTRRRKIMQALLEGDGPLDVGRLYAESGGNLADLRYLADLGLLLLRREQAYRDPLAGLAYDPSVPPQLTSDQAAAWDAIRAVLQRPVPAKPPPPFLLHGVTGSGKTEIYLQAVAETLSVGRQAIVLVPEIALTPQTVRRFMARFPGRVGVVHSRLSTGERYDTWRRARSGQLSVIVGPRSALFAPLADIGLIVVDECHDGSYYQSGILPYYHARETAVEYARLSGAICILGSATPEVVSYRRAEQGEWRLLELPARILAHTDTVRALSEQTGRPSRFRQAGGEVQMADLPPVELVDMRSELKSGNRGIFSRLLHESLEQVLTAGEQAILFLNRRGAATYVFCRDCGEALTCPRCDTSLTYHSGEPSQAGLVCHHCGYTRQMPKTCPHCGSERIRQYGMGTQKVESELQALFPGARTLRWDRDTTQRKGAHDLILEQFSKRGADVLVGTQMLAKGLDLPFVTLVGAVLADVGLHLPDYRAGERVFQVLSQVAGRAGRGPLGGKVILQTFHPEHYVLQAAAAHDYHDFYRRELAYRADLGYPPYSRLVRLEYRHRRTEAAEGEAQRLAAEIQAWLRQEDRRATELIGPTPCFYARREGLYRWQIVLRGPDPAALLDGRELGDWRIEVNPQALL